MMQLFLRYVIGGATGKRESAWFAFALWALWTGWMLWFEANNVERSLDMAQAMWMVVTPFVFTWLGTSHGFEWVSQQTSWGSRQMSLRDVASVASGGNIPDGVLDAIPDTAEHRQFADLPEGTPRNVYDPNTSSGDGPTRVG